MSVRYTVTVTVVKTEPAFYGKSEIVHRMMVSEVPYASWKEAVEAAEVVFLEGQEE